MGFDAPLALLGLLAAGLPLAIHLLRRRDVPDRPLPTLELLRRAERRRARRLRLVDLLLLAARMLLLAAAAVALAGPWVPSDTAFEGGEAGALAIVLDDSASMGRGAGEAWREAVKRARRRIAALPDGSEVAVVLAGEAPRTLVPRTSDLDRATAAIDDLPERPPARGTAIPRAIDVARAELAGSELAQRVVAVLTDDGAETGDAPVRVERFGPPGPLRNDAVVEAAATVDPGDGRTARVRATVRRFGLDDGGPAVATLRVVDGDRTLARAEAPFRGEFARAQLDVALDASAPTVAEVVLDGARDPLPGDDARGLVLRPVRDPLVVLVNGDPHRDPRRDELGYVLRALDAARAPVRRRVVDPGTLSALPLEDVDAVVLANVDLRDGAAARRLGDWADAGGGLVVTGGDRIDGRRLDAHLGSVLGARLRSLAPLRPPRGLVPAHRAADPAAAAALAEGLGGAAIDRAHGLELVDPTLRPALAFEAGDAALVRRETPGGGRVALLAFALDADGSDLPYRPGFVPLVVRLVRWAAGRPEAPAPDVDGGRPVTPAVGPAATAVEVTGPDGRVHRLAPNEPFRDTDGAGPYLTRVRTRGGGWREVPEASFVVSAPIPESDLTASSAERDPAPGPDGEIETVRASTRIQLQPFWFLAVAVLALGEAGLRARRRGGGGRGGTG